MRARFRRWLSETLKNKDFRTCERSTLKINSSCCYGVIIQFSDELGDDYDSIFFLG